MYCSQLVVCSSKMLIVLLSRLPKLCHPLDGPPSQPWKVPPGDLPKDSAFFDGLSMLNTRCRDFTKQWWSPRSSTNAPQTGLPNTGTWTYSCSIMAVNTFTSLPRSWRHGMSLNPMSHVDHPQELQNLAREQFDFDDAEIKFHTPLQHKQLGHFC